MEDYLLFKLNNLQTRMDKCTNEQFWSVTTILAINAMFLTSDFIKGLELFKGVMVILLLAFISIYGVWFVIKRHQSFYFYRAEFAAIVKEEERKSNIENASILAKKPIKYSLNTLSGVVFYCSLIILSTLTSIVFMISSMCV